MGNKWYLLEYNEKVYLHNKTISFCTFPCIDGYHDHCELRWARFSKYDKDLHAGYYEKDSKSWICDDCYMNYKDLFGWSVATWEGPPDKGEIDISGL